MINSDNCQDWVDLGASPDRRREKNAANTGNNQARTINLEKKFLGSATSDEETGIAKTIIDKPHENKLPDIAEKKNNPALSPETKT